MVRLKSVHPAVRFLNMLFVNHDSFPVNITVQIRKNIYTAEVFFDDKANVAYFHPISEAEDYYIKLILTELIPKYQGKGKYFLLLDLRNMPKVGIVIVPLDKLSELYTLTKNSEADNILLNTGN